MKDSILYPERYIGKYVRVDMLYGEGWEFGKLKEVTEDYVVLKMSKHMKEFYSCKEKLIPRHMISMITTFTKEKERDHEEEFFDWIDSETREEERKDEERVELG